MPSSYSGGGVSAWDRVLSGDGVNFDVSTLLPTDRVILGTYVDDMASPLQVGGNIAADDFSIKNFLYLSSDGSASFSAGKTYIDSDGNINVGLNGGIGKAEVFASDGSAYFAASNMTVDGGGNLTVLGDVKVGLYSLSNLGQIVLTAADGSASFAEGGFTVDSEGNLATSSPGGNSFDSGKVVTDGNGNLTVGGTGSFAHGYLVIDDTSGPSGQAGGITFTDNLGGFGHIYATGNVSNAFILNAGVDVDFAIQQHQNLMDGIAFSAINDSNTYNTCFEARGSQILLTALPNAISNGDGSVKTNNNTLDDGAGNMRAANTIYSFQIDTAEISAIGFSAPGDSTVHTLNNTLDDGSGNMTIAGTLTSQTVDSGGLGYLRNNWIIFGNNSFMVDQEFFGAIDVNSGAANIASDGTASFANGAIQITPTALNGGNNALNIGYDGSIGNPFNSLWYVNADGSGAFSNENITFDRVGDLTVASLNVGKFSIDSRGLTNFYGDGTRPVNSTVRAGWQHIQVGEKDAWIPYYR